MGFVVQGPPTGVIWKKRSNAFLSQLQKAGH